jgi:hypothetical protein
MRINYTIVFSLTTVASSLVSMDISPTKFVLDLRAPLPVKQRVQNKKSVSEQFHELTTNNEAQLRALVAEEQRGNYSKKLHKAEEILNLAITMESYAAREFSDFISDKFKNNFVCSISTKRSDRKFLMKTLAQNSKKNKYLIYNDTDFRSIEPCVPLLNHNPFVANAYGSYPPYEDRIITPLHHILHLAADGLIDHDCALHYTKMLLEHRANPNARDDCHYVNNGGYGNTPLHLASSLRLVKLLLEFGADCTKGGNAARTPLHHHIRMKNWYIVRFLLATHNANINSSDVYENTPLHEAVKRDAPADIITLLLIEGANCDAKNNKKKTPIDIAQNKPDILKIFESHLQDRLCDAIAHRKTILIIEDIIKKHSWISLEINGIHILNWAKLYYPHHSGTRDLEELLDKKIIS